MSEHMEAEHRMIELFDELVPSYGKCNTVAGELIRAVAKINYRLYNDGDHIGVGYGNETCNAPARYIEHTVGDESILNTIERMWGEFDDYEYIKLNTELLNLIVDYVNNNPELKSQENNTDMLDFSRDRDYEYEEEEW